jgi:hypothetical protein
MSKVHGLASTICKPSTRLRDSSYSEGESEGGQQEGGSSSDGGGEGREEQDKQQRAKAPPAKKRKRDAEDVHMAAGTLQVARTRNANPQYL